GQGDPSLYPYLSEFVERVSGIEEVEKITMQSNGAFLNSETIKELEPHLTRINLSLNALDPGLASSIAGRGDYDLSEILEVAEDISDSEIDLLIAPVWLQGVNDSEIERIIDFVKDIKEETEPSPIGLQKYIHYSGGRNPDIEEMSFYEFYEKLQDFEDEYDEKLRLGPKDFGIEKRPRTEKKFSEGEKVNAKLVSPGRRKGEMIAASKGRSVAVKSSKNVGDRINLKITRTKHDIYEGIEIQ
ncbi:MAG: radical SAM protein, partial [Candidatus Aenigmatarchaeota archaeon]